MRKSSSSSGNLKVRRAGGALRRRLAVGLGQFHRHKAFHATFPQINLFTGFDLVHVAAPQFLVNPPFVRRLVDQGQQFRAGDNGMVQPSLTDEATFERVFGRTDWAVMFILACGGKTYCRLQYNRGPRGALEPDIEVDYSQPFAGSDHQAWEAEYCAKVHELASLSLFNEPNPREVRHGEDLLVAPARREQSPAIDGADDDYHFYQEEDWHDFCFD